MGITVFIRGSTCCDIVNTWHELYLLLFYIFLGAFLYDTGYPHDGRADNTAYRHDRRADKRRYPHDREIDIQMLKMSRNGYILR